MELAERGRMGRAPIPELESSKKNSSSVERTKIPLPIAPARAVRPRRWIYCSGLAGSPSCITRVTLR